MSPAARMSFLVGQGQALEFMAYALKVQESSSRVRAKLCGCTICMTKSDRICTCRYTKLRVQDFLMGRLLGRLGQLLRVLTMQR